MNTRALDGAVYNEVVDAWMIPRADPYSLENFQRAYDKLAAGRSTQRLSKAQAADFTPAKKLAPTRYALRIYPKIEEEQWQVETMRDVQVSYIPFSFSQLTPDELVKAERSKTRSTANIFPEKSPYTVTYNYTESTDGGPTGPQTFQLPILYTVWPVHKPLPADLEYKMDYEVFLPRASSLNKEVGRILGGEAIAMTQGGATRAFASTMSLQNVRVNGNVYTEDDQLDKNVPLENFIIRHQNGSSITESVVSLSGYYSLDVDMYIPGSPLPTINVPLTFVYQDPYSFTPRWRITSSSSTHALTVSKTVQYPPGASPVQYWNDVVLTSSSRQENEILRAVSYFYNNQNNFNRSSISTPVRIIANSEPNSNLNSIGGTFGYPSTINIYNKGVSNGEVIGTTMHELGHFTHYQGSNLYSSSDEFLKEAFACYVSWYLGQEYYKSVGWIHPGGDTMIVGDTYQTWYKTYDYSYIWNGKPFFSNWYSPLFIDLTDNYNQGENNKYPANYPNDKIQGISPSSIWSIVTTSAYWNTGSQQQQYRQKIVDLVRAFPNYLNWIDDFDEWTRNHPVRTK